MNELRYRIGRAHVLGLMLVVALLSSSLLGYLLARDFALSGHVRVAASAPPAAASATPGQPGGPTSTPGQPGTSPGAPGGSGSAGGGGQGGGSGPVTYPGGVLKVGAVITQSGLGDETSIYKGLDAAFKTIDDHGGIAGIKVSLEVLDDGTDPNRGQAALRQIVEQDKVFALTGECAPLTDIDATNYFDQQGIPVVGPCFAANTQYADRNIFPIVVQPALSGRLMASFLVQQLHAQKPAVVSLDVNVTAQSHDGVVQGIQGTGKQVCDDESVPATQTSYDSVVQNEMQKGCDGVVLNLDPAHTLDWLSSAQRYSYRPQRIGLTAFDQTVIDNAGSAGEGLVAYFGSLLPSAEPGSAAVQQFLQAMHAYHPEEKNPNLAVVGYLAGISFAEAVGKVHGQLTRDSLMSTLESQPIDNGFQPAIQFHPGNHVAATTCRFYQLHSGAYQPISGWYGG